VIFLKIAIAVSGLGHIQRGAERWANDLAYALYEKGVNITIFKGGGKENSDIESIVPCIKRNSPILGGVNSSIPWHRRVQIEQTSFMFFLLPYLSANYYDILHIGDVYSPIILKKAKSVGLVKSKILCTYHGPSFLNNPKSYAAYDAITVPAPYYLWRGQINAKKTGSNIRNWFLLPNFVDTEKFNPHVKSNIREELGIPEDAFLILTVGAMIKRYKRMDYVIKEVARLSKTEDVYLLIVGEQEEENTSYFTT